MIGDQGSYFPEQVFHTAMIVALTIVINGTTAGALYDWLKMCVLRRKSI